MEDKYVVVEEKSSGHFSTLLKGLLIGGLMGAGFALLTAPQRGEETRQILREKGEEWRTKAMSTAETARHRAEELAHQAEKQAYAARGRGQSVFNEQKARLQSVVEGVKEGTRTYKEQSSSYPYSDQEKKTALVPEEFSPDETLDI